MNLEREVLWFQPLNAHDWVLEHRRDGNIVSCFVIFESFQIGKTIRALLKYGLSLITTSNHMIEGTTKLHSGFSSRNRMLRFSWVKSIFMPARDSSNFLNISSLDPSIDEGSE
ncbi:MAG: hypothetical protein HY693_01955 [Deltaproteobacteria bacterium]|nr:hypothetical protein [Deltaproteobacteria bacterium]